MTIRPASDRSLLVSFGERISAGTRDQVARLTRCLEGAQPILNLHPAYVSVLVDFDPSLYDSHEIETLIRLRWAEAQGAGDAAAPTRTVEIPVVYGGEFGPDLDAVARHTGLTPERVIELHASAEYAVYFLGFSPGFPYLGGLPQ